MKKPKGNWHWPKGATGWTWNGPEDQDRPPKPNWIPFTPKREPAGPIEPEGGYKHSDLFDEKNQPRPGVKIRKDGTIFVVPSIGQEIARSPNKEATARYYSDGYQELTQEQRNAELVQWPSPQEFMEAVIAEDFRTTDRRHPPIETYRNAVNSLRNPRLANSIWHRMSMLTGEGLDTASMMQPRADPDKQRLLIWKVAKKICALASDDSIALYPAEITGRDTVKILSLEYEDELRPKHWDVIENYANRAASRFAVEIHWDGAGTITLLDNTNDPEEIEEPDAERVDRIVLETQAKVDALKAEKERGSKYRRDRTLKKSTKNPPDERGA